MYKLTSAKQCRRRLNHGYTEWLTQCKLRRCKSIRLIVKTQWQFHVSAYPSLWSWTNAYSWSMAVAYRMMLSHLQTTASYNIATEMHKSAHYSVTNSLCPWSTVWDQGSRQREYHTVNQACIIIMHLLRLAPNNVYIRLVNFNVINYIWHTYGFNHTHRPFHCRMGTSFLCYCAD